MRAGAPAHASFPMTHNADLSASLLQGPSSRRFEVRSVTGACYTLVEDTDRDGTNGRVHCRYRTAYAGLPVVANDDGSFTLVDTHTRLVRIAAR